MREAFKVEGMAAERDVGLRRGQISDYKQGIQTDITTAVAPELHVKGYCTLTRTPPERGEDRVYGISEKSCMNYEVLVH